MKKISLVIPAYNEEERIEGTLVAYDDFLRQKKKKDRIVYEILVILNGCRDNTLDVVKKVSAKRKSIKYWNYPDPIGKGGALIEGFKKASYELVGFTDADMSNSPESFYDLVENIDDYDAIIASRWVKGAVIKQKQTLSRRVASRTFNLVVKTMFPCIKERDTQCGCKLFKKKALLSVVDHLSVTQWAFDVNLMFLLHKNGYRVREWPTVWDDSGGSHINLKKTSREMFLSVARMRLVYSPLKFVVKVYDKVKGK